MSLLSTVRCSCCCQALDIEMDEVGDTLGVGCGCTSITVKGLLYRSQGPVSIEAQTPVTHLRKDIERVPLLPNWLVGNSSSPSRIIRHRNNRTRGRVP
jgi:hypothetical protein